MTLLTVYLVYFNIVSYLQVSISWSSDMLSHDTLCRHQWEILVEKDGERKLVCSDSTVPG